ncbi:MAG: VWA domain-containing protein [Gammaproteobacteria bacterium]|nr:MAG: VWA domain-containing protein [Gammaproteobacteria bacterium]
MKSKIIALAIMGITATTVALYPSMQSIGAVTPPIVDPVPFRPPVVIQEKEKSAIDVVFVLDTTGSMSGLIQAAKEKIWSIASSMAQAEKAPEIRMGLVGYRDKGDAYVTKVTDLSTDLDSMYARLMDFKAQGGGDGPEHVNQALYDAIHKMSWNQSDNVYKVVFLVGDAPAHMDYQDDVKYPQTLRAALKRGIVVNTIQSGQNHATTSNWQQIASLGQGHYFQVEQSGSAVAIATPYDKKLAELSARLDETRLYYGDAEEKERMEEKIKASKKLHALSSLESRARRAAFNATKSGEKNFVGKNELVDDIASGRVKLDEIDRDALPEPMKAMAPAVQAAMLKDKVEQRQKLQEEIKALADVRSDYLKKKVEAEGGAEESLDEKIFGAVREQAAESGIRYKAESAAY